MTKLIASIMGIFLGYVIFLKVSEIAQSCGTWHEVGSEL